MTASAVPITRPKRTPVAKVVHVDWVRADELLLANEKNRGENQRAIKRFRQLIREGRWTLTNDAITVDRDGLVRNGQHRLFAISSERVSPGLPVMLLEGVDPADRWNYDQGRRRGAADILTMKGKSGSESHVAIARRMAPEKHFDLIEGVDHALTYWPSIMFAHRVVQRHKEDKTIRGLVNSGFAAAVARAHAVGYDVESLLRFTEIVMHDGIGRRFIDRDQSLRWLREHIVVEWNRRGQRIDQTDVFWVTQTVLFHWLNAKSFDHATDPIRHVHLFVGNKLR